MQEISHAAYSFCLNCSLKASNDRERSSTDRLLADVLAALGPYGVKGEIVRSVDRNQAKCAFRYGQGRRLAETQEENTGARHLRARTSDLAWSEWMRF